MRGSIGKRLFVQIMAVLLLFITIALVANSILLKPIYNSVKKNRLITTVEYINSLESDYSNNLNEILEIEEKSTARIIIFGSDELVYMSAARLLQGKWIDEESLGQGKKNNISLIPGLQQPPKIYIEDDGYEIVKQFIPRIIEESSREVVDKKTIITNIITASRSKYLMLETVLDDGLRMIVLAEMQSLNETVKIFNMFLVITAAFSMLIIAIMTYFMSKRFVRPITNMNNVTKKIAKLDFETKCDINTKDELEELGDNINALSGSLESTIIDLKTELENAKRLGELRKRFVSTVSHELKTPISLMQGYAIGLASDVCDEKERRDYYAQVIAEESERLGLLVNELMDLTQLESGYITLHEEDFELSDFLDETINKFQAANPEKSIIFNKPTEETWCRADVKHFERVIGNYLSNALRHVDEKNKISLEIKSESDYYNVTVTNSGSHIPEDKIDEIWSSFYRVDEARNRAHGGHGLGLSIVKNIQIAHAMPYGVRNIGGGVEFSFGVKKADIPN